MARRGQLLRGVGAAALLLSFSRPVLAQPPDRIGVVYPDLVMTDLGNETTAAPVNATVPANATTPVNATTAANVSAPPKVQYSAYSSTGYNPNWDRPGNRTNTFLGYDETDRVLKLDVLELTAQYALDTPEHLGFRVSVDGGGSDHESMRPPGCSATPILCRATPCSTYARPTSATCSTIVCASTSASGPRSSATK